MVANHGVRPGIGERGGCADELNASRTQVRLQKVRHVEADASRALQLGQVPARADAELDDGVGGSDMRRKLLRSQACDPWERLRRNAALAFVIRAAGIALVVASGGAVRRVWHGLEPSRSQLSLSNAERQRSTDAHVRCTNCGRGRPRSGLRLAL